jgi:hypothetical protein
MASRSVNVLVLCTAIAMIGPMACSHPPRSTTVAAPPTIDPRTRFNQLALRLNLPLFWASDDDGDGRADPDEVRTLLFYPTSERWADEEGFASAFAAAVTQIAAADVAPLETDVRRALVVQQMDRIVPRLVETDLRSASGEDRELVRRLLVVADRIDGLFSRQVGMDALRSRLDPADLASASLFRLNFGPSCYWSMMHDARCSAIDGAPRRLVDVYPADMQDEEGAFCTASATRELTPEQRQRRRQGLVTDAEPGPSYEALNAPMAVARRDGDTLRAVPYAEAYADLVGPAAAALREAAHAVPDGPDSLLARYLEAVAVDLESPAGRSPTDSWRALGPDSSRWYISVGVRGDSSWEPCHRKWGYELTLGRYEDGMRSWVERLEPLRPAIDEALAALLPSQSPSGSREFQLPDFVRIVARAGSSRFTPIGGLSRAGRTISFSSGELTADEDAIARRNHAALWREERTADAGSLYEDAFGVATVLHEISHNLGPTAQRCDPGPLAGLATLVADWHAEATAQYLARWLASRGDLDAALADRARVGVIEHDVATLAHGTYSRFGRRNSTVQAAALRVGILVEQGALRWDADAHSADGHAGAFVLDRSRLDAAIAESVRRVFAIEAACDRAALDALLARYVDGEGLPLAIVADRLADRTTTETVYAIRW